jgi:hypothetical protein
VIRSLARVLVWVGVAAFSVGAVSAFSGTRGFLSALLMIGIVLFLIGLFTLQYAGQGMGRAEGPTSFADVDAGPAGDSTRRESSGSAAPRTWTRTWMSIYFWVALGEFWLGTLFLIGGLVSGTSADIEGGFGMAGIMWVIAAPIGFVAYRTAAKDRLHTTGLEGRATVLGVDQTGAWINNNPVTVLDLSIEVDGHPAYEVRHRETVPAVQVGRLTAGMTLPVRVNPAKPSDFIVEWERS